MIGSAETGRILILVAIVGLFVAATVMTGVAAGADRTYDGSEGGDIDDGGDRQIAHTADLETNADADDENDSDSTIDNGSVEFVGNVSGEVGAVIDVPVSLEGADVGYVQLVDTDEMRFQAVAGFEADDGVGEAVLQFNTYAPGDGDSWRVHPDYEDEIRLTETRYASAPELEAPLGAGEYGVVGGLQLDDSYENPVIEAGYDTDTAFFNVTEPTPATALNTSVAPTGTELDGYEAFQNATVTERSEVADGDELLVTVDGFDRAGLLEKLDEGEPVGERLASEGITITLVEQAEWWYVEPRVWSTDPDAAASTDDVYHLTAIVVYTDHYDGDLVLRLEYDGGEEPLDTGGYDLVYETTEESPLVEEDLELETEFEIVEPTAEWDDDAREVPNTENATVSGTTPVAPGGTIATTARSAGTFTDAASATVESDGTFTATYDFSEYESGLELEFEAYPEMRDDEYDDDTPGNTLEAVLVEVREPVITLVADAPAEAEADDDVSLDVVVSNDGGIADDVDVSVTIGGDERMNDTITIDGGEQWTESVDLDVDDGGALDWDVTAGNQTDSGTLLIDDGVEAAIEEPDDESDSTPGFGAIAVLLALLGAATIARHRRG